MSRFKIILGLSSFANHAHFFNCFLVIRRFILNFLFGRDTRHRGERRLNICFFFHFFKGSLVLALLLLLRKRLLQVLEVLLYYSKFLLGSFRRKRTEVGC